MRRSAALLLLLPLAAPVHGQTSTQAAPVVQVATTPASPTVGDHVEVVLTVQAPEKGDLVGAPRFPAWREAWGEAEIVEKGQPEKMTTPEGVTVWRQRLVVTAFRPGQVTLPPVQVALPFQERTLQAQTPANLSLTVRSVLPADEKDPKPRPPAPPQRLPLGDRFWWTVAALGAGCLLLAWLLFRRRKTATEEGTMEIPALPPFEELMGELTRLESEPSALQAHTRISQALRRYLGRALSFPAPESTTSEVHRKLLSHRVPASLVRRTVDLLRACDLVKFARQEAGPERVQERIGAARQLGRDFEMQIHPPAPAETADPGRRWEATG